MRRFHKPFLILALCYIAVSPALGAEGDVLARWPVDTLALADGGRMVLTDPIARVFKAGSWTFQAYGSVSFGDEAGEVYMAHVGGGYVLWDDISVNLEVVAGGIDIAERQEDSASIVGLDLVGRWHFHHEGPWSVYAEIGAGLQQSSEPIPSAGTHFNFRPQLGIGCTHEVDDGAKLMAGVRWIHISNADKDGDTNNPGFDAAMFYWGLTVPF